MHPKKILIVSYLIALHLLLAITLIKTDVISPAAVKLGVSKPEIPDMESTIADRRICQQNIDSFVPQDATLFLGDSITHGLTTHMIASIASPAVNYGIGWQRSDQLLKAIDGYKSIKRARQVVIMIGTNDILQGKERDIESRYKTILNKIPTNVNVILTSVPPIGNIEWLGRRFKTSKVYKVVLSAKKACNNSPNCKFINVYNTLSTNGTPLSGVLMDDGIHLTPKGYELWIAQIRQIIASNDYVRKSDLQNSSH